MSLLLIALAEVGAIGTRVLLWGFTAELLRCRGLNQSGSRGAPVSGDTTGTFRSVIGGGLIGMDVAATSIYTSAAFVLMGRVFMELVSWLRDDPAR